MKEFCVGLHEVDRVAKYLKELSSKEKCIFLLQGDLASGKTTLVRAYTHLIYPDELVTSPTFSLMHRYGEIYHYDLYNKSLSEILHLGFLEWLENQGVHFVEWGDEAVNKLLKENGYNVFVIKLHKQGNTRTYRISNG